MSGYTKLFGSILDSTVWDLPHATVRVWVTMLAMADRHGEVHAAVPGLAHRARVTLEEAEAALTAFLAPDKYSRTPDNEGRRVEAIDRGWRLVNHEKYTRLMSEEDRKARAVERQQRYVKNRQSASTGVNKRQNDDTQTETQTQTQTQTRSEKSAPVRDEPTAPPPVLVFPCTGQVTEWPLTEAWLEEARAAFPRFDVLADLRKALAKINTGAVGKKTAKGMSRFLMNWLGSTNDKLPANSKPSAPDPRCDWHKDPRNDSKPSMFNKFQCPRCRHFAAARAKRDGPPVDIGEIMAAKSAELEQATERQRLADAEKFRDERQRDAGG